MAKDRISMVATLGTFPAMVRPDTIGGEMFSTMVEVHVGVLGITCGALIVLFFAFGWEDVGLLLLLLFSLTALGYLPFEGRGEVLRYIRFEPWYFLSALAVVPGLYASRGLVRGASDGVSREPTPVEAEQYGGGMAGEVAPSDD